MTKETAIKIFDSRQDSRKITNKAEQLPEIHENKLKQKQGKVSKRPKTKQPRRIKRHEKTNGRSRLEIIHTEN